MKQSHMQVYPQVSKCILAPIESEVRGMQGHQNGWLQNATAPVRDPNTIVKG